MKVSVKSYDGQTKWIYFLIEDESLLEKYKTIWDKVSSDIKKELDRKPVYRKSFLKNKIESCSDETKAFHDIKMSKAGSNCICLAVVNVNSPLKKDENCYLQEFLKELWKYMEKEVIRYIIGDPEISSDESDE